MRRKIWIQVIATCPLFFIVLAPVFYIPAVRDGGVFWIAAWLLASISIYGGFIGLTLIEPGRDNIALRQDGTYTDLGSGRLALGVKKLWAEAIIYNPKPRDLRQSVSLPARDGTVLSAKVSLTWQPDKNRIDAFFEQEPETRLPDSVVAHLQRWSKQYLPGDLYFNSPPLLELPGIIVTSLTLTDIVSEQGSMNRYIWDSTHLMQTIVNEIQDEDRIEAKRAELMREYPERADRINQLVEQRKAVLRKRGLRENR